MMTRGSFTGSWEFDAVRVQPAPAPPRNQCRFALFGLTAASNSNCIWYRKDTIIGHHGRGGTKSGAIQQSSRRSTREMQAYISPSGEPSSWIQYSVHRPRALCSSVLIAGGASSFDGSSERLRRVRTGQRHAGRKNAY